MPAHVPSHVDLVAALSLFDVPIEVIASFQQTPHDDLAHAFTDALCQSPHAIVTDWRFHPGNALREIFLRLYPLGVKGMLEAGDAKTGNPKLDAPWRDLPGGPTPLEANLLPGKLEQVWREEESEMLTR